MIMRKEVGQTSWSDPVRKASKGCVESNSEIVSIHCLGLFQRKYYATRQKESHFLGLPKK